MHKTVYHSQFTVVEDDRPFKTHTRDCTGLERAISTSTELVVSRGELLMKWTKSGGTCGASGEGKNIYDYSLQSNYITANISF